MALCSRSSDDPLLRALLDQGINLILPPRDGIVPGDLLIADSDRKVRQASWNSVFGIEPNAAVVDQTPYKSFTVAVSRQLEFGFGSKVASSLLSTFGLKEAGLSAALANSGCETVRFRLLGPARQALAKDNFDQILDQLRDAAAVPKPAYEGARFFVVQATSRSRALRLNLYDKSGKNVKLQAEAEKLLSANVGLTAKRDDEGWLEFVAPEALVFGVETRELQFDGGLVTDQATKVPLSFRSSSETPVMIGTPDDSAFVEVAPLER